MSAGSQRLQTKEFHRQNAALTAHPQTQTPSERKDCPELSADAKTKTVSMFARLTGILNCGVRGCGDSTTV